MALGVWLCEGINSVGDPGLSVPVMKTQFEDTKAKIIICYEGSRKKVHDALNENGQLGKTKVLVLEKACPEKNDDEPIFEENFEFVADFMKNAEKLPQPPMLQNGIPKDDETFVIFWSSGTTGQPKGIEHSINSYRYALAAIQKSSPKSNSKITWMTTTCFFHAGGFGSFFQLLTYPLSIVFNHGPDIDEGLCDGTYGILYPILE